jgi:hypothetical protein
MTDQETNDDGVFEKDWSEKFRLTIKVSNRDGFDFFKVRGEALRFSDIKPKGSDWERVKKNDDDEDWDQLLVECGNRSGSVTWRRREVTTKEDKLKRS